MPLDIPPAASNGIKIPNFLDLANGIQSYRAGNIELQKAQQANQDRVALQQFTSNPDNWQTDGKIDMDKINAAVPQIAPLTGPEWMGKMSTLSSAQTSAAQAAQNLTQEQRGIVAGPIGVLGRAGVQDPAAYSSELDNLVNTNPGNADIARLAESYKQILKTMGPGGHVAQGAVTASQALLNPAQQQAGLSPQATTFNLGGVVSPGIVTPAIAGNAPSVQIGNLPPGAAASTSIGPSERQTMTTDVLGQPAVAVKDNNGTLSYQAPPGANYKPVMRFPAGETAQTMPENQAIRAQANSLGAAAPTQHFNNKMILDLTPDAFTGTGGSKLANVMNTVGLGSFIPKSAADIGPATAQLRHFIALQVEQNASAQGANTDAARNLAAQAVLPSDSPEKAIKAITKVNDAYVTGNALYNQGLEAAIANPANQSGIYASRQFRNAWSAAFDPRVMMLKNAQQAGDQETINRVLGPPGSAQRAAVSKELVPEVQAMHALETGQIPGQQP